MLGKVEMCEKSHVRHFLGAALVAAVTFVALRSSAAPPVVPLEKAKKACTFVVGFRNLSVYYERVIVIGKRELPPDTPDEFWVVFPDREKHEVLRDGKHLLQPDNVQAAQVLFVDPKDGPVMVIHKMKLCRCPAFFWGSTSGVTAEDR